MLEVSPLVLEMEEELLGWKGCALKVADLVAIKHEQEGAVVCALEEVRRLDAEAKLMAEAEVKCQAELEV
jgi:hypothetical protein